MIVVVSLNASIDQMVEIESFQYGGINRIQRGRHEDGAGKGINVALAAKTLGLDVACIGFLPEENAERILNRLDKDNCMHDFIRVKGSVRINTKIYDREKGVVTELNEAGPPIKQQDLDTMLALMQKWQKKASIFVMTGSLPPNCPVDFYRKLIMQTKVRCILDTEGEKLLRGIEAKPFLIKPNDYELGLAVGKNLEERKDLLAAVRSLIDGNVDMALVSMGERGAFIADRTKSWFAPRIPIEVKSTVGAGDCMVAGILYALSMESDMEYILRCGIAAGTAGCLTERTQLLRREDFSVLLKKVQIESI